MTPHADTGYPPASRRVAPPWSIDRIAFDRIAHARIVDEDTWLYVLAAASFVESLSDLYTRNLLDYMADDAEVSHWLRERWEPEKLQHGRALRRYVETVWPAFDWPAAFDGFCVDYRPHCKSELLEPTRALEMVARYVIETGTSGLYGMLQRISPEPVLATLAGHIRNDEVGHYKYFYHFFLRYRQREHPSRWQVARVLRQRLGGIGQEDAYLALKNAVAVRNPGQTFGPQNFQYFQHMAGALGTRRLPLRHDGKNAAQAPVPARFHQSPGVAVAGASGSARRGAVMEAAHAAAFCRRVHESTSCAADRNACGRQTERDSAACCLLDARRSCFGVTTRYEIAAPTPAAGYADKQSVP